MPWHAVQALNMTCLTGPLGGSTCGRVGFSRNCAATGATAAADMTAATDHSAPRLHVIGSSPLHGSRNEASPQTAESRPPRRPDEPSLLGGRSAAAAKTD